MSAVSLDQIADRLARLESQNQRLKQLGMSSVCFLLLLGLISFNALRHARQIEAEEFVVRDRAGQTRATLNLREGEPTLALFDQAGREQVLLRSTETHASSLEFLQRGQLKMVLESASTGASHLQMLGSSHALAASLYAWPEGAAGLALSEAQGVAHLAVNSNKPPRLEILDSKGRSHTAWPVDTENPAESEASIRRASWILPLTGPIGSFLNQREFGHPEPIKDKVLHGAPLHSNAAMSP